ncbi:MAG: glycosyltransferase family 4 protein [Nitrospinaceae bacterium]
MPDGFGLRLPFFSSTDAADRQSIVVLRLVKIIKESRPDILHTHSSIDSWLASVIGKFLGVPIVRSRHISIPVKNIFPNTLIYSSFPERIITSGEAISEIISGLPGVAAETVVSIPAGVDLRRFDCRISGDGIRRKLNVEPDQPLVGKIGVVRGWKGHDYFLEAVPHVLEHCPKARFVIVGDGPGYDEVNAKMRAKGLETSLTMMGHREDVPEIMAALDVQVMASIAGEGTPQVIPQAFAMKTPLVATPIGSIPDLLGHGERGILVEPKSGKSLAEGILKILNDPGLSGPMTESAYEYCRKHLTVNEMIDRTLSVYYEVLNSRAS